MGMYTGLRFKGHVKPEYRKTVKEILNDPSDDCWGNSSVDFCQKFGRFGRSSMFPGAALDYMPYDWKNGDNVIFNYYDTESGYWSFSLSIKNYEGEIDYFLENVLGRLAESVDFCETYYEEDKASDFWVKSDDTMKSLGRGSGIVYRTWGDE